MSLQVWLPLNGDLHNQGLMNIIATNNGATLNDSGKIGSCYSFNGSNSYLIGNPAPLNKNNTEWSYTCWFKPNTQHQGCLFSNRNSANAAGLAIFYYTTQILFDDGTRWQFTPTTAITINQWNHLAFTRSPTGKKMYLNGVLINSTTTIGTPTTVADASRFSVGGSLNGATTVNGNWVNGYLNDVRIYDHCLSAKEVEEISKGLVLHYKLNGQKNYVSNIPENLFIGSGFSQRDINNFVSNSSTDWTKYFRFYNGSAALHSFNNGVDNITLNSTANIGIAFVRKATDINLDSSSYYTISCEAKCTSNSKPFCIGLSYYTTGNSWTWRGGSNGQNFTAVDTWQTFTLKFKPDANTQYICYCFTVATGGNNTLSIRNCKLEKGSTATAWCLNPVDENYLQTIASQTEGYTQEFDCSGYNNNGTVLGTLTIDNNTSKYNCSTLFNGTDNAIKVPYNAICPTNIFTINLWFYKSALGAKNYETLFGGPSGFEMDTRSGASTTLSLYMASTRGGNVYSPFSLNTWYMVTMVRDGTNEYYYVNGELVKTIEAKSMPTGVYRIGAWASDTGQNYYGNISDFRIYATCLTETQIKELYNTSMTIDNNGNGYVREVIEDSKLSITKTGQFHNNELLDDNTFTTASITATDHQLKVNNFYEY